VLAGVLTGTLSAKPDSLSVSAGSHQETLNSKVAAERQESLAVELLLRDLDISIHDSPPSPLPEPSSKTVRSKKNDMVSSKDSIKRKTADIQAEPGILSFGKRVYDALPGIVFLRANIVPFLILLAGALAIAGVLALFRYSKDTNRFLTTGRLSIMDKEVQLACDYIEENYANKDLSVTDLCTALTTGAAFLQALFHNELGISVEDFIDQVRVNKVKHFINKNLAADTETLVALTGFADKKTLEETFLAVTGADIDTFRKLADVQDNE